MDTICPSGVVGVKDAEEEEFLDNAGDATLEYVADAEDAFDEFLDNAGDATLEYAEDAEDAFDELRNIDAEEEEEFLDNSAPSKFADGVTIPCRCISRCNASCILNRKVDDGGNCCGSWAPAVPLFCDCAAAAYAPR